MNDEHARDGLLGDFLRSSTSLCECVLVIIVVVVVVVVVVAFERTV